MFTKEELAYIELLVNVDRNNMYKEFRKDITNTRYTKAILQSESILEKVREM